MVVKLKVRAKDEEWTLEHKILEYENFELDQDHPIVLAHIKEIIELFPGDKEKCKITVKNDLLIA